MPLRIVAGLAVLFMATAAGASAWVAHYEGEAESISIERNGLPVVLQPLMLLDPQDVISVSDDNSVLVVLNEQREQTTVTIENSPYIVPGSAEPPSLLLNIRNWIESWWETRANQSTTTLAAVSKGDLDPTVLVADTLDNYVLAGQRSLVVAWQGGSPPFEVALVDNQSTTLTRIADIEEYRVTLPATRLVAEQRLQIRVSGGLGDGAIPINVVDADALPDVAISLSELNLPDEVAQSNLAFVLSGLSAWRYEAMQLADSQGMDELVESLLLNTAPRLDEGELTRTLGDND